LDDPVELAGAMARDRASVVAVGAGLSPTTVGSASALLPVGVTSVEDDVQAAKSNPNNTSISIGRCSIIF